MLPEMFCNANDSDCRPPTAVVSASKIPITLSPFDPGGEPALPGHGRHRRRHRKRCAKLKNARDQRLEQKCPGPKTGAQLPGGQQLPGRGVNQVADGAPGWNCSAKPSMQ